MKASDIEMELGIGTDYVSLGKDSDWFVVRHQTGFNIWWGMYDTLVQAKHDYERIAAQLREDHRQPEDLDL